MKTKANFKFENQKPHESNQETLVMNKLKEYKSMIVELNTIYGINKKALSLNIKELKDGYEKQLIEVLNQENELLYSAYVRNFLRDDENSVQAVIQEIPTLARENIEIYKINTLAKKYLDLKAKNEKLSKKLKQMNNENHKESSLAHRINELDYLKSKLNINKANMLFLKHRNQMKKEIDELRYKLDDTKAIKNDIVKINFVN